MGKPIVRIENWSIEDNRLKGQVFHHPHIEDGSEVTTSEILSNFIGSMETKNTLYQLGKRAPLIKPEKKK